MECKLRKRSILLFFVTLFWVGKSQLGDSQNEIVPTNFDESFTYILPEHTETFKIWSWFADKRYTGIKIKLRIDELFEDSNDHARVNNYCDTTSDPVGYYVLIRAIRYSDVTPDEGLKLCGIGHKLEIYLGYVNGVSVELVSHGENLYPVKIVEFDIVKKYEQLEVETSTDNTWEADNTQSKWQNSAPADKFVFTDPFQSL